MALKNRLRKPRRAGGMEYQHVTVILPDVIAWLAYAAFCVFVIGLGVKKRGKSCLGIYRRLRLRRREERECFSCGILQSGAHDDCTGRGAG